MEYSHLLYQIGNLTWIGYVLALLVAFYLKVGNKSYFFGALVLVIANLAMQLTEPLLVQLAASHKELVRALWYPTWATFDLISIYAIYLLHIRARCSIGFESASLVISFAALSLLQGIRYFDQFYFATNYLVEAYKISINSINIACLIIVLLPLMRWLRKKAAPTANWISTKTMRRPE